MSGASPSMICVKREKASTSLFLPASPTTRMRTLSMASASEALGTDDPAPVRDDHIDLECEKRGKGARGRENCFFSF